MINHITGNPDGIDIAYKDGEFGSVKWERLSWTKKQATAFILYNGSVLTNLKTTIRGARTHGRIVTDAKKKYGITVGGGRKCEDGWNRIDGRFWIRRGYPIFAFWRMPTVAQFHKILKHFDKSPDKVWVKVKPSLGKDETGYCRGTDYKQNDIVFVPPEMRHLISMAEHTDFGSRLQAKRATLTNFETPAQMILQRKGTSE